MPTYCLCHHQENFFLGIDCVFFARSISAELDWQWSRKQEGLVRFMIDSKDTAQRMMCLVPKTSTTCAETKLYQILVVIASNQTTKAPQATPPRPLPSEAASCMDLAASVFSATVQIVPESTHATNGFSRSPRLHAPERPSQIRSSCRARCYHSVAPSATGGRKRPHAGATGRHRHPGFRTGGTPQRRRPLVSSPSFVFFFVIISMPISALSPNLS